MGKRGTKWFWTEEMSDVLRKYYYLTQSDTAIKVKEITGVEVTAQQVKSRRSHMGLKTGRVSCVKGQPSYNKGKKWSEVHNFPIPESMRKTQFKKGNIPCFTRPVGSERLNIDGYFEIKVGEPNKWRLKHRVLYEQYNNVVLKTSDCIAFLDGDKTNLSKDNLVLISHFQNALLNTKKLRSSDKEITKVGILATEVLQKVRELENGK